MLANVPTRGRLIRKSSKLRCHAATQDALLAVNSRLQTVMNSILRCDGDAGHCADPLHNIALARAARDARNSGVSDALILTAINLAKSGEREWRGMGEPTSLALETLIVTGIREVVVMGGAHFNGGNITPVAEFNLYADPQAAEVVLRSGVKLTYLPLDVTHKALTNRARIEAFRALGNEPGRMVAEWTDFFERFDMQKYGSEGAPLHDPCVIAYLLRPDLFAGRHINVEIETQSDLTLGMTVADWWGVTDRKANALFIGSVDAEGFFALLTERIGRL